MAVLEDKREAVRSGEISFGVLQAGSADDRLSEEGLSLLIALTVSSPELQKLVAFESAFERIFGIIDAEGSLTHGGITVQECLSLLANLLRLNASNQSYFRETGWVKKLAALFSQTIVEENSKGGVADWARPQRDKNLWGLLAVVRLFLLRGSIGTQANQRSLCQSGVLAQVLEIAFHQSFDMTIRAEVSLRLRIYLRILIAVFKALITSADLIKGNGSLQEAFAQFEVLSTQAAEVPPQVNGHVREKIPPARDNVISGLLDLALASSSLQSFDVRLASCECLKAYFFGHAPIRLYFLQRAIEGHTHREADNILSILTDASENGHGSDPYRSWIASVLLFHLLFEDFEAKNLARTVAEGDANAGEEVITCVQAIAGNFISAKQKGEDERVILGYLMVLCGWLYEDHDAVNDFLGEGSNVQSMVQILTHSQQSQPLTSGVCAFLLGIIYEFSTKDSPISRDTLHQILTTQLSREQYVDKITKLREHPVVRDFEVLPQNLHSSHFGGLPEVFFDKTFVDFLKDNFSRIIRAIDRAPNIEVPVIANGVQKGISRELVDSLKAQVEDANQRIQKLEADIVTHERKLGQEQADHRKAKDTSAIELNRIKSINEALQRNHEDELQRISRDHQVVQMNHQKASEEAIRSLQNEIRRSREEYDAAANRVRLRNEEEAEDLKSTIGSLEGKLEKSSKDHVQDLQTQHEEHIAKVSNLEARLRRTEDKESDAEARSASLQKEVDEKEAARRSAQTELDDLFLVLGELEEKRAKDKVCLYLRVGFVNLR